MTISRARACAGFTLIEVLITTLIVAIILGALLVPLSAQFQARRFQQAEAELASIRAALMGYVLVNGRFPCPDNDSENPVVQADGVEDADGAPGCTPVTGQALDIAYRGHLPWSTLGVPPTEPWGNYYRYQVMQGLTIVALPGSGCPPGNANLSLCSNSNMSIVWRGDDPTTTPAVETHFTNVIATQVAAVVFSTGPNGHGSRSPSRFTPAPFNQAAANPFGHDEYSNVADVSTPAGAAFATRRMQLVQGPQRSRDPSAPCDDTPNTGGATPNPPCAFDDVMVWIPLNEVKSRLVDTGWLP